MNAYSKVVERLESMAWECNAIGIPKNFKIIVTEDFYEELRECYQWKKKNRVDEVPEMFLQWDLEINYDLTGEVFTVINQRIER